MTLNAANVEAGYTGQILVGLTTASAPTATTGSLTGFTDLGYMSDDGITESRSRDTNDIAAWQGGATVKTTISGASATFQFTMIEATLGTLSLYYGLPAGAVTQTSAHGTFDVDPGATGGPQSFVIDEVTNTNAIRRTYIALGEVTEVDDRTNVNGEVIGYNVTVSAYPSSTLNGKSYRVWMTELKTA